jgi:hypothetical protein
MKAYEVVKGSAKGALTHGRIMMAIEGEGSKVRNAVQAMLEDGFFDAYTDCAEEGDKEGEVAHFFVIDRNDKPYFMARWRVNKRFT